MWQRWKEKVHIYDFYKYSIVNVPYKLNLVTITKNRNNSILIFTLFQVSDIRNFFTLCNSFFLFHFVTFVETNEVAAFFLIGQRRTSSRGLFWQSRSKKTDEKRLPTVFGLSKTLKSDNCTFQCFSEIAKLLCFMQFSYFEQYIQFNKTVKLI